MGSGVNGSEGGRGKGLGSRLWGLRVVGSQGGPGVRE